MCCVIGYTGHDISADKFKEYLMRTVSRGPDDQRVVEGPFGLMGFGRLAIMGLTDDDEHLSGEVLWEGRDLLKMSKKEWFGLRGTDIAMVYQDALSSLNPSMLISAQMKQLTKRGGTRSAEELLELVGLDPKRTLESYPHELSGGQRQRVAMGRAIVRNPKVFLMDEPLSNLDAKLRVQMRAEIASLHQRLGATIIYVTHDQTEAMTLGTRIVVLKDGVIQQVGKPMDLYEHPVNKFVAGFIGSPQMNFYDVKVDGKKLIFADGNTVELPEAIAKRIAGYSEVIMGIRGEDIKFDTTNLDVYGSHQKAVIDNTEIMGNENNLYFDFGGSVTIARVSKYEVSQVGDEVEFTFMPHKMHFFDKETEQVIGAE